MSSQINFAKAVGIDSLPGAILFIILYIPLFIWFLCKSVIHPTQVHYALTFFCTLRVVAFVIRSVLAGSESAGENLKLLIADEALFGIGYFSLLYSAYDLVLDRILLTDSSLPDNPILRLTQNRRLFRIAIIIALILGIISSSTTNSDGTTSSSTSSLHIVSTIIFLILTILQALQTIILARKDASGVQNKYFLRDKNTMGVRYGNYVLVIVSLLLLVREAFATATVKDNAKQNNEHFWYPLLAVPEILAVIFFATPGLVPRGDEVPPYSVNPAVPYV